MSLDEKTPPPRGVISLKAALFLYALLLAGAMFVTHGNARIVVALIIILLAVKSWVAYRRDRLP
jgi:hypothetical protein